MKIKCVNKVRDNNGNIKKYQLVTEHGQKFEATAQQIKAEMKAKHYEFVNLQLSSDGRLIDKNFAALNIPENHKNPVFNAIYIGYNIQTGKYDHFLVYDSIHHRHSWSIWNKYKPTAKYNPYNNLSVVNGELKCNGCSIVKMTPAMIKTAKLPDLMYKIVLDTIKDDCLYLEYEEDDILQNLSDENKKKIKNITGTFDKAWGEGATQRWIDDIIDDLVADKSVYFVNDEDVRLIVSKNSKKIKDELINEIADGIIINYDSEENNHYDIDDWLRHYSIKLDCSNEELKDAIDKEVKKVLKL